jgi:hypothetical protein
MQLRHLSFFCLCALAMLPLLWGLADHGDWRWHLRWQRAYFESWQQGVLFPIWVSDADHGLGSPAFSFYAPGSFAASALLQWFGLSAVTAFQTLLAVGQVGLLRAGYKVDAHWGAAVMLLPVMFLSYFWQAPAALLGAMFAVWSIFLAQQNAVTKAACCAIACSAFHTISALMLLLTLGLVWISKKRSAQEWRYVATWLVISAVISLPFWAPALLLSQHVDMNYLREHEPYQIACNLFPLQVQHCGAYPLVRHWLNAVQLMFSLVLIASLYSAYRDRSLRVALIMCASIWILSTLIALPAYRLVPGLDLIQYGWRWWPLLAFVLLIVLHQLKAQRTLRVYAAISVVFAITLVPRLQLGMPSYAWVKRDTSEIASYQTTLAAPEHRPKTEDRMRLAIWLDRTRSASTIDAAGMQMREASRAELRQFCFPGWQAFANNQSLDVECDPSYRFMRFDLPKGEVKLELRYTRPPIFAWCWLASIAGLAVAIGLPRRSALL